MFLISFSTDSKRIEVITTSISKKEAFRELLKHYWDDDQEYANEKVGGWISCDKDAAYVQLWNNSVWFYYIAEEIEDVKKRIGGGIDCVEDFKNKFDINSMDCTVFDFEEFDELD